LRIGYLVPVLTFYGALLAALASVAWTFQTFNLPSNSYFLRPSSIESIVITPFANNWSDFVGSAANMLFFLLFFVILVSFDDSLKSRKGLRLFFCVSPIAGGLLGAAIFYVKLVYSGTPSGGAGSSIIAAAMAGVILVLSAVTGAESLQPLRIVRALLPLALAISTVAIFYLDFGPPGNTTAHVLGFASGVILAYLYAKLMF
jgi:membrane associated rhomboid family serine protease